MGAREQESKGTVEHGSKRAREQGDRRAWEQESKGARLLQCSIAGVGAGAGPGDIIAPLDGDRPGKGGAAMPYEYIAVEQRGRAGIITFNKPDRLNVVNYDMFGEVRQAIHCL